MSKCLCPDEKGDKFSHHPGAKLRLIIVHGSGGLDWRKGEMMPRLFDSFLSVTNYSSFCRVLV